MTNKKTTEVETCFVAFVAKRIRIFFRYIARKVKNM